MFEHVDVQCVTIMNPKKIAVRYLKFWFWLDLLATIPFDLIGISSGDDDQSGNDNIGTSTSALRAFKILRLIRCLSRPLGGMHMEPCASSGEE